jgi:hypothetical protein
MTTIESSNKKTFFRRTTMKISTFFKKISKKFNYKDEERSIQTWNIIRKSFQWSLKEKNAENSF